MHKTNGKIPFLEKEMDSQRQVKRKLSHVVQIHVCLKRDSAVNLSFDSLRMRRIFYIANTKIIFKMRCQKPEKLLLCCGAKKIWLLSGFKP